MRVVDTTDKIQVRRWRSHWIVHVPRLCGFPREVVYLETFAGAIETMDFILGAYRPEPKSRRARLVDRS